MEHEPTMSVGMEVQSHGNGYRDPSVFCPGVRFHLWMTMVAFGLVVSIRVLFPEIPLWVFVGFMCVFCVTFLPILVRGIRDWLAFRQKHHEWKKREEHDRALARVVLRGGFGELCLVLREAKAIVPNRRVYWSHLHPSSQPILTLYLAVALIIWLWIVGEQEMDRVLAAQIGLGLALLVSLHGWWRGFRCCIDGTTLTLERLWFRRVVASKSYSLEGARLECDFVRGEAALHTEDGDATVGIGSLVCPHAFVSDLIRAILGEALGDRPGRLEMRGAAAA